MTLCDFILLLDSAQPENTNILINIDGEEAEYCTLGDALNKISAIRFCGLENQQKIQSLLFGDDTITIEL